MNTFFLMLIALTPGIGIAIYVYFMDRHEPEPIKLILISFLFGILSFGVDLLLVIPLDRIFPNKEKDLMNKAIYVFIVVAFLEELSKFLFVRGILYKNKNFNEPLDGIIYSVMVGMGFATTENIIYTMSDGGGTGVLRMFSAIPAHALFAILMGYMLGKAKFTHHREGWYSIGALAVATLLHGIYNYFLSISFIHGVWIGSLIALIIGFIFSRKAVQIHDQASPFKKKLN